MKKIFLGLLSFVCLTGIQRLDAQNYVDDLRAYMKAYQNFDNKKMEVLVKTYALPTDTKAKNTVQYTVYKKNGLFCQKSNMMTMALVGSKFIMVDHGHKKLIYKDVKQGSPESQKLNVQYTQGQVDSLLKNLDKYKIAYEGLQGNTKTYRIDNIDKVMQAIWISFDTNTHKLQKMVYAYHKNDFNESSKVEIIFNEQDLLQEDEAIFRESSYLETKQNNLIPVAKYKGYQVVHIKD